MPCCHLFKTLSPWNASVCAFFFTDNFYFSLREQELLKTFQNIFMDFVFREKKTLKRKGFRNCVAHPFHFVAEETEAQREDTAQSHTPINDKAKTTHPSLFSSVVITSAFDSDNSGINLGKCVNLSKSKPKIGHKNR